MALLLINLGTPDKPEKKYVRRYLSEFLNDPRVIDIPWLIQKILVNLIIIPFRVKNSTRLYQRLWTENGSPLLFYLDNLAQKLQTRLTGKYTVIKAMRYGQPSIAAALKMLKSNSFNQVTVLPLFPQYASSTTGSIAASIFNEMQSWQAIPSLRMINQFYQQPAFINAFVQQIKRYQPAQYDHIIFSYHGLPYRQINKIHPNSQCHTCSCTKTMPQQGTMCYKATCYETTRLLAKDCGLSEKTYTVAFQSRLSKNWLAPFTDELIVKLARQGAKNILITAPSFVADCLETTVELEYEYKQLFIKNGGQKLTLVASLNDEDHWADAIVDLL